MFNSIITFFKTSGAFTTDIFVLVGLFIFFFIYALYFGKNRIVSFLLAFYPAVFLYTQFPFKDRLQFLHGANLALLNEVIIFLIFLVPIDIIIGKYIFSDSFGGSGHYLRIAGYALGAVVLVLVFSYTVISLESVYNFTTQIDNLFSASRVFWWTLAPFVLLFLL